MYIKVLNIIILLTLSIFSSYAAYETNSSWTDLVVENDGWCANLEVPFTIYNETDFLNKEAIEDDLCEGNETPDEDSCSEFNTISGNVKIYDGPLVNSDKKILDTSLSESSFKYTFTKEGVYYMEIFPTGNYNDWYREDIDEMLFIEDCNIGTSSESTNETVEEVEEVNLEKDQSFHYETHKTTIDLTSSTINSSEDLIVKTYTNPSAVGLAALPNSIKVVQVLGESDFTDLTISSTLDTIIGGNSIIKVHKYNTNSNSWSEISNGVVEGNTMTISSAELGIYAVTEEQEEIIEEIVQTPEIIEEVTPSIVEEDTTPIVTASTSDGPNMIIVYSLLGLLAIVIGSVIYSKKGKAAKKEKEPEHVVSYADILAKAQGYVVEHKEKYSQDQIYRALKEAKVPKDIIDKVFALEYTSNQ